MASQGELNALYSELLGRAPDAGGVKTYTPVNANQVRSFILASPEYATRQTNLRSSAEAARNQSLTDYANQQKAESQALLTRQKQEEEGLFSNYENIRKNQEALPALYNRLTNEAGIPELSNQAQGFKNEIYKVKGTLDRLGEDVVARTTGYNVSDAQRRRLETAEAEPLQTNLGRLGTGLAPIADMLSSAQRGVETQLGLETQQQDRALEPVKLRINAISDRFAREITGFTSDRELGLTTLLDKIQRERQISDQEWKLAQELAAEERAFARQKAAAATQLSGFSTNTGAAAPATAPKQIYQPLPQAPPTSLQQAQTGSLAGLSNFSGGSGLQVNKVSTGTIPGLRF